MGIIEEYREEFLDISEYYGSHCDWGISWLLLIILRLILKPIFFDEPEDLKDKDLGDTP